MRAFALGHQVLEEDVLVALLNIQAGAGREKHRRGLPPARMPWRASSDPGLPRIVAAGIVALTAAGCVSGSDLRPGSSAGLTAPAAFGRERLIGRWGIASFHNDKDRKRTEGEARAQCSLPYTIAKGPTDGVMMHVADDPKALRTQVERQHCGKDLSRLRGARGRSAGP